MVIGEKRYRRQRRRRHSINAALFNFPSHSFVLFSSSMQKQFLLSNQQTLFISFVVTIKYSMIALYFV